jgi:hypothetical protein
MHHQSIIFDSIKKVLDKHKKSDHEGIRWLATIDTKEDLKVAKRSLDFISYLGESKGSLERQS